MVRVTIFTPSYNRASLLKGLCESLLKQTCKDFEWVVVDDGSSDNTRQVMADLIRTADFPVHYYYKGNGGKHTALNLGVQLAKGELFLILDSDDELPPNSIVDILEAYEEVKDNAEIGGVCGYMAHRDGKVIGHPEIKGDMSEIDLRYRYHVVGDMCEVFRTEILREYPYIEIPGERFCPEALVWNRIAQIYKLHIFSKVIYLRDYLDGGLTDNIVRIRMNSPIASMMTYAEMTRMEIPWVQKAKAAINYYRFKGCLTEEHAQEAGCAIPFISRCWLWTKPLGMLMHLRDA